MSILVLGLNHNTAPIEIRERVWVAQEKLPDALAALRVRPDGELREGAIVSTCNRLEIYAVAPEPSQGMAQIEAALADFQRIATEALHSHLYRHEDAAAARHLMRVAAGLDSLILGEPQILGQVAAAYGTAQQAGTSGSILSHLFSLAVRAGKRARSETEISRHTTSVSHAAVLLVRSEIGALHKARTVVVGAGEMARLAARALHMHGAHSITCINRTRAAAEALARHVNGDVHDWHDLPKALVEADVIITATAAPQAIIRAEDMQRMLPHRKQHRLVMVDIGIPRNVEPAVAGLEGVTLHDMYDLQRVVDGNRVQREATIPQVETIVAEELSRFLNWYRSRAVVPVIADLRRRAEAVAQAEVERALRQLDSLEDYEHEVINRMAHRIINRLLHEPTVRLKAGAADGNGHEQALSLRELFGLDGEAGDGRG